MLAKDRIRHLMEMVADGKLKAEEALLFYKKGSSVAETFTAANKFEEIAIVGISGRFPDADSVEAFWANLKQGKDSVGELKRDRFDISRYYNANPNVPGKSISKWGGQLSGVDKFDAAFFNITPLQAEFMDPRQRLFLEETWKALENACMSDRYLQNRKCAVFVGCEGSTDYFQNTGVEQSGQYFLGYSNSVLAARIAYFANLKGPSVTVDTGCSSSLVAIHLACESLRNGDNEVAIAGGIQLMNRPFGYILLSKAGMLSPTGKCRAFDADADGIVPGEAVGVVILKRLTDAIKDRDHIYGVILGSGINQDGKTNGITAPSSLAQTQLECEVYDKYGINPEQISYVEAHGTGTPLGDPIEIEALENSFSKYTNKRQYCAIGSVKTNIGHTFAAAGVTSLIKVLLCFEHMQIPPSLHYRKANRHIDFENSHFYVNTKLEDWNPPHNSYRMAAINSFGHSGTNCHLVVREYKAMKKVGKKALPYYLIVFSAKTIDSLCLQLKNIKKWLVSGGESNDIGDIAYSLLVGRSFFEYRYGFVVANVAELKAKIGELLAEGPELRISSANQKRSLDKEQGKQLLQELSKENQLTPLQYKGKLIALGEHFLQKTELDFDFLYIGCGYHKIVLPTYPFNRDSYWLAELDEQKDGRNGQSLTKLHPLIGENISTLSEFKFRASLTGEEYFFKNHQINGKMILPGAVEVEMAIAAALLADPGKRWLEVTKVRWFQPIIFEQSALDVQISLQRLTEDIVSFDIYQEDKKNRTKAVSGKLTLLREDNKTVKQQFSIQDLTGRCNRSFQGEQCYALFDSFGITFGSSFRGLQQIWVNEREAIGRLELPAELSQTDQQYILNPVLLDGAFQTAMGILLNTAGYFEGVNLPNNRQDLSLYIPYLINRLTVYRPIPQQGYAYVIQRFPQTNRIPPNPEFDIYILSDNGEVIVEIQQYTVAQSIGTWKYEESERNKFVKLYYPIWSKALLNNQASGRIKKPVNGDIVIFDNNESFYRFMKSVTEGQSKVALVRPGNAYDHCLDSIYEITPGNESHIKALFTELTKRGFVIEKIIFLWPLRPDVLEGKDQNTLLQMTYLSTVFICQAMILSQKPIGVSFLYVYRYSNGKEQVINGAMSGFAKTLGQENPAYRMKIIGIETTEQNSDAALINQSLLGELEDGKISEIRYAGGIRYQKTYELINKDNGAPFQKKGLKVDFKDSGVYIITGGMGGIGIALAKLIIDHIKVRLILTGRSEISDNIRNTLRELSSTGSEVVYFKADCSNRKEVDELIKFAHQYFGPINGVIHNAGIIRDSYILKKTAAEIFEVLAPKVSGTFNLDEALQDEKLDFFVMSSSLTSIFGNVGQSDYAFANGFMDGFAVYREALCQKGERFGKTIAINWPFWKDGGMAADPMLVEQMQRRFGIVPLHNKTGFTILQTVMELAQNQVVVIPVNDTAPDLFSSLAEPDTHIAGAGSFDTQNRSLLQEQTIRYLQEIISEQTKIPLSKLNIEESFDNYGIDSMIINKINYELDKSIPGLSKTLFFEYRNLKTLAEYLTEKHELQLKTFFASNQATVKTNIAEADVKKDFQPILSQPPVAVQNTGLPQDSGFDTYPEEEIAIIGVSGRYPMADDLDQYWENLQEGRDCITEIPKDRWDHSKFYDPDREKNGGIYTKWGGFINGFDEFDPIHFKISPREAELVDPQERLFLQCAYHTLEDAGYTAASLQTKRVGVFVGVMYGQYQLFGAESQPDRMIPLSSSYASIANRVSYYFDFHGPSMALDSMCSSSLTALHLACNSIKNGDCELAIVGGVNLTIHPAKYLLLCAQKFASSDGRCRSFGAGGDGYVPGEGVGAVLLKPLSKAKRDKDNIYAVIKGSAVNHCGKTNGYTVPDPNMQGAMIAEVFRKSLISPESIGYIEAHGTGTALGDPIEINGLNKAYDEFIPESRRADFRQTCPIGSVKSNIGHLESAAGIAAVTKVLLMMRHKKLVASLHSENINPNIDFENSYFYPQKTLEEWKIKEVLQQGIIKRYPRRAGISSFGAGGSNAHVILEEYEISNEESNTEIQTQIIVLSAINKEQAKQKALLLADFLTKRKDDPMLTLGNLAFTLQIGREVMKYRVALIGSDLNEIIDLLKMFCKDQQMDGKIFTSEQIGQEYLLQTGDSGGNDGLSQAMRLPVQDWGEIAKAWVAGASIPWRQFYTTLPHRISLPLHPFQKRRCWFSGYTKSAHTKQELVDIRSESAFSKDWELLSEKYHGSEVTLTLIDRTIALVKMQDKTNKNMFTQEMVAGLMSAFKTIHENEAVKVIIVTGYENIFCMGGTQESLIAIAERRAQFTDMPFLYKGFLESSIPIITAMQGHAFGGGLLFGLYGDLIVMSQESLYCANFMNFGFTPGMGATFILEEKLGGLATEMMLTGNTYRGAELQKRGCPSIIFTHQDNVLNEALNLARSLAEKPKKALQVLKKQISSKASGPLAQALDQELQMHLLTFGSAEVKEKINRHFGIKEIKKNI